jgi:hypothetical protein
MPGRFVGAARKSREALNASGLEILSTVLLPKYNKFKLVYFHFL